MATLKERLEARKAAQAGQTKQPTLKQKLIAKNAVPETEEQAYERNWYDAPRAALQGMTMGFSDELGALAGAGIAKGAQFFNDDETEYLDIYDQMKSRINDERKTYEKENPAEALALNIAGGLLTGGIGAEKVLATKTMQNAGKLKKALAMTALGSAEGAVAGAGSADEGKRLEGAALGGTIGAVLPAALSGGKGVIDVASNRRIAEELKDSAGNFLPINQAAPEGSPLGNIYQKIIAPSFGGQKLRDQNRAVLNRATHALDESKEGLKYLKTTGKSIDDAKLRNLVKSNSLPANVSEEFKTKILQSDGHEAIKNIDQAWNNGFEVVKNKTFNINPKELVDEVVAGLDTLTSQEFSGNISSIIKRKIKGGFTPDMAEPDVKYLTSGVGSTKAPQVELDTGKVDGAWLMQARNDLRMQANELTDQGGDALQVHALKRSAAKIDDLIRANLDEADNATFSKELENWGNYQQGKRATSSAGTTQQGLYEPQQLLQSGRINQPRKFATGDAPFQTQAQTQQVNQNNLLDRADKQIELDTASLGDIKGKLPNLNPDPWTKGVSTGTLGAAPLALIPGVGAATAAATAIPLGYTIGKVASTEGAQRAVAGQTNMQKTIAELLRKYENSQAQQAVQSGQGALSRGIIMQGEQ